MKDLLKKAERHNAYLESVKQDITVNNKRLAWLQTELDKQTSLNHDTTYAAEYLNKTIKIQSDKFIGQIRDILDYGIRNIFDDKEYSIDIKINDGKAAIHLLYQDENGFTVNPDIQNCGGGIRTVIGVLLQIFFIFQHKVEPILIVDEGFSQLSDRYLPNLFSVIKQICKTNGLKLLLVTHDPRLQQYADAHYKIDNGVAKEISDDQTYTA